MYVIILGCYHLCYHLMLSFLTVSKCYHFYVIIFPSTCWVLSFMLLFDVIIYCYHFPPFFFFLKTWHAVYQPTLLALEADHTANPRSRQSLLTLVSINCILTLVSALNVNTWSRQPLFNLAHVKNVQNSNLILVIVCRRIPETHDPDLVFIPTGWVLPHPHPGQPLGQVGNKALTL